MTFHFNISSLWKKWRFGHTHLPAHLPRFQLGVWEHPRFVRDCSVTQEAIEFLSLLDWEQLPVTLASRRTGYRTIPLAAYVGSYLVKIDQQIATFGRLRCFLKQHPALIWALGFPLVEDKSQPHGFDVEASLPTQRHLSRKLSELPNEIVQNLLDGQVSWLQKHLDPSFGQTVSIDTKHIIAWVKENNPKQYIKEGRFDKEKQPTGDPDCKVGCKRRRNQMTPTKQGQPAGEKVSIGEYYWGYASGVVATKLAGVGEFILAEATQTFDHGDLTYFFPLMEQVERRLGFRPRYGTADAAFDAHYVYDYFHGKEHDGFAAIPLRQMNAVRLFDEEGLPLCEAKLPMYLKGTYTNRTSMVQHKRGRYLCPLLHPQQTADSCPVDHDKWPDGGCKLVMPTSAGARIRYQLDRDGARYKQLYKQRTAVERIFSQAVELGIERPKLRNQLAIANQNTLTYLYINLRSMHRLALGQID